MARSWLVDSRAIAKKVKHASWSSSIQITDCGAHRECPNCHHRIDNSDVSPQWPGLPAGVKFDPSDAEILEHLAAKCGIGDSKPHPFVDEFIPTLEEDMGICYTHPENLPGAKKDGSSIHFFHRTINAYATGQRKRRKIQSQHDTNEEHVRWHKTGKTKPVMENGVHKGWKKIMVLYKSSKRGCRPKKSNWVMHQFHLGAEEEEHDGEYVVSKISYQQQKQNEKNDNGSPMIEEPDNLASRTSPRTPKTSTPDPPRPWKSMANDDPDENMHHVPQEAKFSAEGSHLPILAVECEDGLDYPAWLAGESQGAGSSDLNCLKNSLLCNELLDSSSPLKNSVKNSGCAHGTIEMTGNNDASRGISVLENLEFDTPPDLPLADLQFGSQESIRSWLDRL